MQKLRTLLAILVLTSLSTVSFAHGGHDHSHWLSQPIHLLTVTVVATIVVISTALFVRRAARVKARK